MRLFQLLEELEINSEELVLLPTNALTPKGKKRKELGKELREEHYAPSPWLKIEGSEVFINRNVIEDPDNATVSSALKEGKTFVFKQEVIVLRLKQK